MRGDRQMRARARSTNPGARPFAAAGTRPAAGRAGNRAALPLPGSATGRRRKWSRIPLTVRPELVEGRSFLLAPSARPSTSLRTNESLPKGCHLYAIAIGSNRPHGRFAPPPQVVEAAIARLDQEFGLFDASSIILNPAYGGAGRNFANAVALVESDLDPPEMLRRLK